MPASKLPPKAEDPGDLEPAALNAIVAAFRGKRVLVLGDLMLDEYRIGDVERVSPEAPVSIVRVANVEQTPGGAGNVARNVVSMGANCSLAGLVGEDAEGAAFLAALSELGVDLRGVMASARRPTTHKQRVVVRDQQMLRLDREERDELTGSERDFSKSFLFERLSDFDVVILEDYDKGIFRGLPQSGLAALVIERARELGLPVIADPKTDLRRFRGATLVKPNFEEARQFVASSASAAEGGSPSARRAMLEKIREEVGGGEIVMTRGGDGMSALDRAGAFVEVPTRKLAVYDVQGAGDTSVATLALSRAAGASLVQACIVANAASSVAVEKVGTASVSHEELLARLPDCGAAWREAISAATDQGASSQTEEDK